MHKNNLPMEEFLLEKIEEIAFETVSKNDSLWESRVLDSITIVELAVEIETEYGIKIGFDEIIVENFETVEKLINFVKSKQ